MAGEILWNLAPMSLPEPQPQGGPHAIEQELEAYARSEAVQLFVERAAEATRDFALTAANAATVANLCHRLDGLPLAIELAAARVRALSVAEISERLDSRFRLLTGGGRTAPARQQTLEATLDWSHALLTESEAKVLRRLSVFAGGGTLEAAEAVLGRGDIESGDVLDLILHLADRSILTMNRGRPQSTRWRMLEVIRQYAQRKLEEAGERIAYREHHLDYFREWAERADSHVRGPQQLEWLDLFQADHDNLRAALEWSLGAPGRAEAAMGLAASCAEYWRIRGHFAEAESQLKAALGLQESGGPTRARAAALTHLAHIAYMQTRYPEMRPVAEEALSIWRGLGQGGRAGLAKILDLLGELSSEEGDYDASYQYFEDALSIYRELNDGLGIGEMSMQIGWATMRTGDYARAEEYLLECLERMREVGTVRNVTFALSGCGEVALRQGRYEDARRRLQEALDLARQSGDKWLIGAVLGSLGWAALLERDFGRMRQRLGESLSVRTEIGDKGGTAWCLEKLAEAALVLHQSMTAVRGFAAASALRAPMGSVIDPADLPDYERMQAKLKAELGEDGYSEAWNSGESAPVEGIIGELLALESPRPE